MQDLRYAARWLVRNRLFTGAVVLTLAIAIGVNTAVFSVVNAALFPPPPFEDSDRLIEVDDENNKIVTFNDYENLWQYVDFLESVASYKIKGWFLSGYGEPKRILGFSVSSSFLSTLKVQPAIGRNFTYQEDHSGSPFVVLISDEMWRAVFGANPQILGKVIQLDGQPCEIIGVMGPNFKFPNKIIRQPQFWTTLGYEKAHLSRNSTKRIFTIGRLKPNITLMEAQERLNSIAKSFKAQGYKFKITRLNEFKKRFSNYTISIMLIVICGVLLVLMIACSNITSLLLSRSITRKKEIAIRIALGANRGQLIRQLLTESLLLCSLGGLTGFLLIYWFRNPITVLLSPVIRVGGNWFTGAPPDTINLRVFGFAVFTTFLTGLITGLAPALHASKTDLNSALKEGTLAASQDSRSRNFHNFFVVLQMALALLLLTGAGLMVRSILRLQKVELGFDPNYIQLDVPLAYYKYPEPSDWKNFSKQLLERVQSLAGVQHAAIQSQNYIYIQIEDQRNLPEEERWISCMTSSADYFKVVGAVLISGRSFLESENESSPAVVVVNQTFVRKFLHGKNPVGAQIHLAFDPPVSAQIIGVVRDMKQELETDVEPGVYLPYRQQPQQWISVIVRGIFQTPSISKALYEQVWAIDSNQFVYDAYPMSEWLKQSTSERRSIMFLLSFFAIVAIVLAIVGIYSVISYATNRQTHEIGIRMSMGAQKKDVIRMIMKKAALLILIGTTIGLILSFVLNRFLEKLIYGISRNDPVTYISVSVLVIAVAFIASGIPALRAAKVDPVVALREE